VDCRYDANADYRLDRFEFERLCSDAGREMEPAEVQAALSAIDENGNGYIEFNEFVAFWKNPKEKVKKVSEAEMGEQAMVAGAAGESRPTESVTNSKD
jgi:hypothetical protein